MSPQSLLVDDGDQLWRLAVRCEVGSLVAADFVELQVDSAESGEPRQSVSAASLLARPVGTDQPFPSPGGDYFRINRDRRRQILAQRGRALATIRGYFSRHDFLEIEAPLIVPSPGLELHLQGFSVADASQESPPRYLITSPEYQLKRLLVAGLPRIYSLGKVFRSGEAGPHHNPEFTMLEWYRAFAGWESVAADVAALAAELATAIHGSPRFTRHDDRGQKQLIDLSLPWPQRTVRQVVKELANLDIRGDESVDELAQKIAQGGYRIPQPTLRNEQGEPSWAWDDLFFSVFLDHVESKLALPGSDGVLRPMVLCDWPRPLCALARRKPGFPEVVERFEAYVAGLELCNGFGELCDPAEQRQRFVQDLVERQRRGLPAYPIDERFLAALAEGLPPSGGVALGVDRLLMLLLDAKHIRDVLPFASDEL